MNTVPGIGLAYRNWNSLYFLPVKKFFKTKESGCLHGCYSYPQCSGSTTFLRGSGSADPCLWLMDPDPDHGSGSCNFCHWPWQQKIFYTICFACYFLKVHLHYFSKTKSQKESQNSRIQGFFILFLPDDRRIQIQSRIRIHISDQWIREAKKHVDPDP